MTASAVTLVEPAFCTHPPYDWTLGPEVADLARLVGFGPDPEQALGLDLIFGMRAGDRPAAFEFAVVCSRQNLKTGLFKQAGLGKLFLLEQRLVVWSAHEFPTVAEAFRDLTELIEGCSYLSRRVKSIYRGNGDESIELHGGPRMIFRTRTKGGGRGLSGDTVFLDEGMFLQAQHMGALEPTLSARPAPQMLYGASAGLAESAVLREVRDRGRAGDPRLAYLEWCDDLPGTCAKPNCRHGRDAVGCRLDEPARWARANPAMGRRIDVDFIAGERRALPAAEFARERLGWWDDPPDASPLWSVISEQSWRARGGAVGRPDGAVCFALAAAWPDAEFGSVGVAGRHGGETLMQVLDHRPGTGWMVERVVGLDDAHENLGFVLDEAGPAGRLKADLVAAGFAVAAKTDPAQPRKGGRVLLVPTARDVAQAAGGFYTSVCGDEPDLRHYDQPELDAAVAGAQKRSLGDAWAWARKDAADTSPVEVVTLAAWGHATRAYLADQPFLAAWR